MKIKASQSKRSNYIQKTPPRVAARMQPQVKNRGTKNSRKPKK